MKYSIVIPTYIRPVELSICVNKIFNLLNENLHLVVILDGSPLNVKEIFNSYESPFLHLIEGDGNLYWGGAINKGMMYSFDILKVDRTIWLNDDTAFSSDSISKFISTKYEYNSIVGARLFADNVNRNIYGVPKESGLVDVKYLNGNFTSIPISVYEKYGNIDCQKYPHFADAPYFDQISRNEFKFICNTDVTVEIHYDVLRHLSIFDQFILRDKRFQYINWSLSDIRSKWYLPYRKNYYLNKFGLKGWLYFIVGFLRDWSAAFLISPLILVCENKMKSKVLKRLSNQLSNNEFTSLLKEVK